MSDASERFKNRPGDPYQGNEPFIFVSYRHASWREVYPTIKMLIEHGYRVWYDEGIEAGSEWRCVIQERVESCSIMIPFVSSKFCESSNCRSELSMAYEDKKIIIPIYLDGAKPTHGVRPMVSDFQGIYQHQIPNDDLYFNRLLSFKSLGVARLPESDRLNESNTDDKSNHWMGFSEVLLRLVNEERYYVDLLNCDTSETATINETLRAIRIIADKTTAKKVAARISERALLRINILETADINEVTFACMFLDKTGATYRVSTSSGRSEVRSNGSRKNPVDHLLAMSKIIKPKPDTYRIILQDFDDDDKNYTITAVRALTGASLKEARDLVESAPIIVMEVSTKEVAAKAKMILEKAGATALVSCSNAFMEHTLDPRSVV